MSVPNVNLFLGYVDSTKDNSDLEYVQNNFEARRFYSSGKDYDYVKYVNSGSKEKLDFVAYSGNNEKSHGIFNENGLMNEKQIAELREKLRSTKSTIWHGVISFTETFGNLNCDTYEKALDLMKNEFPKFFKNANLVPENIVWFAGLHENTDNKHIHFSFFEKEPLRYVQNSRFKEFSDGFIDKNAINQFKIDIEKHFLNNAFNISKNRKEIITLSKEILSKNGAIMKKINNLIFVLPARGRLAYDSENMKDIKPLVDEISTKIINSDKNLRQKVNNFADFLAKRDNELLKAYSKIKVDCTDKLLTDKCMSDLYRRIGNIVILTAKEIKAKQRKMECDTTNRLILKHIEKRKRKYLIDRCMKLNDIVNKEIMSAFEEYRAKLEEINYLRLKDEGYID